MAGQVICKDRVIFHVMQNFTLSIFIWFLIGTQSDGEILCSVYGINSHTFSRAFKKANSGRSLYAVYKSTYEFINKAQESSYMYS